MEVDSKRPKDKDISFVMEFKRDDKMGVMRLKRFWTNMNAWELKDVINKSLDNIVNTDSFVTHIINCKNKKCKTEYHKFYNKLKKKIKYQFNTKEFWGEYWEKMNWKKNE